MDLDRIASILDASRAEGRDFLLETEGLALLEAMGIATPIHRFLPFSATGSSGDGPDAVDLLDLHDFPSDHVVLKVVSADIQHKSEIAGVEFVERSSPAVRAAVRRMTLAVRDRAPQARIEGFLVAECVPFERSLGHEFIVGLRWNDDLGPVAVFGPGGIHTEFLARSFREGKDLAVISPYLGRGEDQDAMDEAGRSGPVARALGNVAITPILTAGLRGQSPLISLDALVRVVERFLTLGREFVPDRIAEIEVNPFVVSPDPRIRSAPAIPTPEAPAPILNRVVALDVVVRLGRPAPERAPARPLAKIDCLLHPKSIALAGVSETQKNPGRIILDNLVAGGFDPARLHVIKPGATEVAGVRCVPSPGALPERVDLAVLSIAAADLPGMVTEFIEAEKAESLIVIPGGLEEKQGGEAIARRMHEALGASRKTEWGGPVINGGNCLGIQSRPGNYDTLFIPRYKLPVPQGDAAPVALLCQSGAHMVANLDRLGGVVPRYSISAGNQTDLTVGDYLTFLADDPEIRVFACYIEGFRPLDGLAFFQAAERIVKSGRTVLLYLAGRTPSGAKASASHTASLAGDYPVLRATAAQVGVVLARNLANFADLLQLFALLGDKPVNGAKLGAISNAGFECVAIADSIRAFQFASFSSATQDRLRGVLESARIESIVDLNNPLDLTPMSGDAAFAEAIAAVMEDAGVDVGVIGVVPLTAALQTLEPGPNHGEDLRRDGGIAGRMAALEERLDKPWVAVVDGGGRYDAFARELRCHGIPTFRTADRAVKLFEAFVGEKLRRRKTASLRS